jgi:hypothetical protein
LIEALKTQQGKLVEIVSERDLKVRKGQDTIKKRSTMQCRIGMVYDELASVQEKRENGALPEENQGLPWGKWVAFPYLIEHKGEFYVRCTVDKAAKLTSPTFTRGGEIISREVAQAAALASEFSDRSDTDIFNLRVSTIETISAINNETLKG